MGFGKMWEKEAVDGLRALINETRHHLDNGVRKLEAMQEVYFEKSAHFHEKKEMDLIRYYLRVIVHRYYMASISLEQLQALRYNRINEEILPALENSLDRLDCSDNERLLVSFGLECFLFEVCAFLDLYMLQTCLLLRTGYTGSMTRKRFFIELAKVQQGPFAEKARWVEDYFNSRVYGAYNGISFPRNDWGELVKSLRHKIAHRDLVRESFDSEETLIKGIILDWPTLQGMTYHSFCEEVRSGMFYLFHDVSSYLFDLEWRPGAYQEGMFNVRNT